jgi:hypothetical protein
LTATGFGLQRVTAVKTDTHPETPVSSGDKSAVVTAPYHLLLSAPADSVEIDTGRVVRPSTEQSVISGLLELDAKNPRLELIVHWKNAPTTGEHRFAKLTIERPGQETLVHFFDADGDIDDILELPFPTANHE